METARLSKKRMLLPALVLAVAVVLVGALLAGCGSATSPQAGTQAAGTLLDVIVVSGQGEATSMPDKATIEISVQNDGATSAAALDACSKDTQKLLDRLKAEGVADKNIETAGVVVYPNRYYDSETGQEKTVGYRATNSITVTFDDLTTVGDIYAAATEAGADYIYGPTWELADDNNAVLTALADAVENARVKAEALAATQGVELGDAIIITEGGVSVPSAIYGRAEAGYAADSAVTAPPISPQKIEVTASVSVTYPMVR